ncbi:MAG: hypothetical protein ACR2QL_00300 [Woeseiaceae bacterium]
MSNDRDQDKCVSETYRSLASEKTPQHLDRKILQMAAEQSKRPLYSRWMAWSRPLAWAATITLCLAIALELAREPSLEPLPAIPDDIAYELTVPESHYAAEPERGTVRGDLRKDEAAQLENEQSREMPAALADAIASEKTALARSAASQPTNEPPAPVYEVEEQKAKTSVEMFRYDDRSAAKMTTANAAAGVLEADMAIEEILVADDCPEIIQSDPETWLNCILNLEKAGDEESAERERDALIDTFPDFKMP